jgi:hypothetical protein
MCFSHVQLSISGTTLIYNTIREIKLCVDLKLDPVPKVFSSFDKHFKNMLQNCTRKFHKI